MSAERNQKALEDLYKAFADPNCDFGEHTAKFVTPDCRWAVSYMPTTTARDAGVPFVQPFTGPDGVKEYFELWKNEVEVKQFDVDKIISADDKVMAWTHQKFVVKKTGKEVEDYVLHEFTMSPDGKIAEHVHWCDTGKHVAAWTA